MARLKLIVYIQYFPAGARMQRRPRGLSSCAIYNLVINLSITKLNSAKAQERHALSNAESLRQQWGFVTTG